MSSTENSANPGIRVSGVHFVWDTKRGICLGNGLPVTLMWVDTTLAGLMAGAQAMVGTERFALALQSEGRKSVEQDWQVISQFADFTEGFQAIARVAAASGWGDWSLVSLDDEEKVCLIRVRNSWEGSYQRALNVCWGSAMLAGKMAGYCTRLFGENCWAEQTAYIAKGADYDELVVRPSSRSVEDEIERLLESDEATRADMAVALHRLEKEVERRQALEHALRRESEKNISLLRNGSDGIHILDTEGNVWEASDSFCSMLGYSRDEVIGMNVRQWDVLIPPEDLLNVIREQVDLGVRSQFETRHRRKDGSLFDAEVSGFPVEIEDTTYVFYSSRDITERKRNSEELERYRSKLEQLVEERTADLKEAHQKLVDTQFAMDSVGIGIHWVNLETGRLIYVNRYAAALLGYSIAEMLQLRVSDIASDLPLSSLSSMKKEIEKQGHLQFESGHRRKDGRELPVEISAFYKEPHTDSPARLIMFVTDITRRKQAEAFMEHLATHDALTNLYNRRALEERLTQDIERAIRYRQCLSAFMLDIDHFKRINDTFGHQTGDIAIKEFASLLSASMRKTDYIGRYGGEEFVIILPETPLQEAAEIAERIRACIAGHTFSIESHPPLQITTSIGVATFPEHGQSLIALMQAADSAMYFAKSKGRNKVMTALHG